MEQRPLDLLNNWKVVLGIAGIILAVLLLSFVLSMFAQEKKDSQSVATVQNSSNSPVQSLNNTLEKVYQDDDFSFKYPSDWQVSVSRFENGGKVVQVSSLGGQNASVPFVVQVSPATASDAASTGQILTKLGLISRNGVLDGVPVSVYSGQIQTLQTTAQEKAIVATYKGNFYLIKYLTSDGTLQKKLDNIFTSFHFRKN